MTYSPFAVDVILPEELAELFGDVATRPSPVRSTVTSLLVDATVASTAITFLQGPPAVGYWVEVVKKWLRHRRDSGVTTVTVDGPNGTATIVLKEHPDVAQLAAALHTVLFPPDANPGRDDDDIAL